MREEHLNVRVFLDTNIVAAYLFEEKNRFDIAYRVIKSSTARGISIITIHELYNLALRLGVADRFNEAKRLIEKAFKVHPLSQEACLKATELRHRYRLPEVDALILATAIANGYTKFYTFDKDFQSLHSTVIEGTEVIYLE